MTTDTLTTVSFLVTSIFRGERCPRGLPVACLTCRLGIALSPSVANPYGVTILQSYSLLHTADDCHLMGAFSMPVGGIGSRCCWFDEAFRQRPYFVEYTRSHPNSEVKRRKARSVLGWGTAREALRVLLAFCICCCCVIFFSHPSRSCDVAIVAWAC